MDHPMQAIYIDENETPRFKENKIVKFLLDNGNFDMNKLAVMGFSDQDREQFAQLIGYSISGFGELPYASSENVAIADEEANDMYKAHIKMKELKIAQARFQQTLKDLDLVKPVIMHGFDESKFNTTMFKALIKEGWRDTSYGNDMMPSLEIGEEDEDGNGEYRLWIAEVNPSDREDESIKQYCLCYRDENSQWQVMYEDEYPGQIIMILKGLKLIPKKSDDSKETKVDK